MKLPVDQRSQQLRADFIPVLSESVTAALNVWYAVSYELARGDAGLERLATIKQLSWRMREMGGRERSNIAAGIASNTPITADLAQANRLIRSNVSLLFEELQTLTATSDAFPAIAKAVASVKQLYFKDFRTLADQMQALGGPDKPYTMTPAQWVEVTTPQIASLLDILTAASAASQSLASEAVRQALIEFEIAMAACLGSIFGAFLVFWRVSRRVTAPLSHVERIVQHLSANDLSVSIPGDARP